MLPTNRDPQGGGYKGISPEGIFLTKRHPRGLNWSTRCLKSQVSDTRENKE